MAEDKKRALAEQKPEPKPAEKKEKWMNWLAITTILFSAAATLATFRGGGLSTRAVLAQSKASDNWAYYQAKSIKQHTYDLQRDVAGLLALNASAENKAVFQTKLKRYEDEVARYKKEKAEIEAEAKKFEAEKSRCQKIGAPFGIAIPYLQVAIMLSALGALMKKRFLWIVGCGFGLIGLGYFAYAYYLFEIQAALIAV